MDHEHDHAVGLDQQVEGQGREVLGRFRRGSAASELVAPARPALEGPAVVIAADTGDLSRFQEFDDEVGRRAIPDDVAGADDLVGSQVGQVRPGQFEGGRVAVDVGDEAELHGRLDPSRSRPAWAASSAERSVAASTALMRAARRPPRSSACKPAMVVPPGLVTWSFSTPGC